MAKIALPTGITGGFSPLKRRTSNRGRFAVFTKEIWAQINYLGSRLPLKLGLAVELRISIADGTAQRNHQGTILAKFSLFGYYGGWLTGFRFSLGEVGFRNARVRKGFCRVVELPFIGSAHGTVHWAHVGR